MTDPHFMRNPLKTMLEWFCDDPQTTYDAVRREFKEVKERLFGDSEIATREDFEEIMREMFLPIPGAPPLINHARGMLTVKLEQKYAAWKETQR